MKNYKLTMIATVALCSLGACHDHKIKEDMAAVPDVSVAYPIVDSVGLYHSYPGYLAAGTSVDVVARVNGRILSKHFADGDYVRQGQPLFTIESSTYQDAVDQAAAALASARATKQYAESQYKAMQEAYRGDAVSEMDVEKARQAVAAANASIASSEAQLRTAQTKLGHCTVRAASDGHISAPSVGVGDYVAGEDGAVKMATIYDDKQMKAHFSIDDARYLKMIDNRQLDDAALNHVEICFNDTLPHKYYGKLVYVAPDIDKATGTMAMRVAVDNPYGELKSGMFATVKLPVGGVADAILVRDDAISTNQHGRYLYVVNDSNRIVYAPVTVSELYHDSLRIVTSGLRPTDRYVTEALLKVRPGMKINPIK
jgi:RND family efflux transporter MFP subunit